MDELIADVTRKYVVEIWSGREVQVLDIGFDIIFRPDFLHP
jgi:hypothetical protein